MEMYEDCSPDSFNSCILIRRKNGHIMTQQELNNDVYCSIEGELTLGFLDDKLDYVPELNEDNPVVIKTAKDKIEFVYASLYNDELVDNLVKKILPQIKKINVPAKRVIDKYYLKYWMEKYNFTLEEFITDTSYIVLVDNRFWHMFYDFKKYGIINYNNIEFCSEDEEEVENED